MEIVKLTSENYPLWNEYVTASPNGLPQHLAEWREIIAETYGCQTCYLMAMEGKRPFGIIPLFFIRSRLLGNRAVTMPGGLCADDGQTAAALIQEAMAMADQAGMKQLTLQDGRLPYATIAQTSDQHVHWIIELTDGVDAAWSSLGRETRRQVRLASKNGLTVKIDTHPDRLNDFYDVFSRFTRQVGTPVFGRDFLQRITAVFPHNYTIAVVYKEEQPIGGYFQLLHGNTVYGTWGATLQPYLAERAVYLAYWEILNRAVADGYQYWDMGRSPKGSGASTFKAKWRGISHPVYQQIVAANGRLQNGNVAATSNIHSDAKLQQFSRIWRKLPLSLTRKMGPVLRKHIPFG